MDASGLALQGVNLGALLASPLQMGVTRRVAIGFDPFPGAHLAQEMVDQGWPVFPFGGANFAYQNNVYNVAIAPDDPAFWAAVTAGPLDTDAPPPTPAGAIDQDAPLEVFITTNAGASWQRTNFLPYYNGLGGAPDVGFISCIDISPNYGGRRDVAVGVRNNAIGNLNIPALNALFELFVLQSTGFTGWQIQGVNPVAAATVFPQPLKGNGGTADIMDLEFSPTYVGDASLAIVYAENPGTLDSTWFDIMVRDLDTNQALSYVYANSIEVKDPLDAPQTSPDATTIVSATLELPSDFSGQSPSLRRAYVSIDAFGDTVANSNSSGIYRIDDTYVYELMDTSGQGQWGRRIGDIAYFGTYASGKLLAGEVVGNCCEASVMTWFTDSPTTCPIPCWYPALKPPTGAAGFDECWDDPNPICDCAPDNNRQYGNALVDWTADGTLAYAVTGYYVPLVGGGAGPANWWFQVVHPIYEQQPGVVPRFHDETAFSISRNNGETWNQTNYIDTNLNQNCPGDHG
jgi:hypothetical protein